MSESLFPEVDGEVVVSEIMMLRAEKNQAILIVEGGSDEKILGDFIDYDSCSVVISEGKDNALAAIRIADSEGISGVICIVDRDYDDFFDIDVANDNIIVTEHHDMENIVLRSRALEKVLREYGSRTKVERLVAAGNPPFEILVRAGYSLGLLRYISLRDNLRLKFEGLNLRAYSRQNLTLDEERLCRDVCNHSRSALPPADLVARLNAAKGQGHCRYMICCGHDLTSLLGKALQSLIGSNNASISEREEIERYLRLAYSYDDFRISNVYGGLADWQTRNNGYQILRVA